MTQQAPISERVRSKLELIACVLLIAQLFVMEYVLVRSYLQKPENVAFVPIGVIGIVSIAVLFYFLRFIWLPLPEEHAVLFSYLFLNYWLALLIAFSVLFAMFSVFGFLLSDQILVKRTAFLAVWLCCSVIVVVGAIRRMRRLQETDACQTAEARIARARLRISRSGDDIGQPMRLQHVPWVIFAAVVMVLIGPGVFVFAVLHWVMNGFRWFLLVPFSFGVVFSVMPAYYLKGLIDALCGRAAEKKHHDARPEKPTLPQRIAETSIFPFRDKVRSKLFDLSLILLLLSVFSLGLLTVSVTDEQPVAFVGSLLLFITVSASVSNWGDDLKKEMKKVKPAIDLTRQQMHEAMGGIISLGYVFSFLLLLGGLAILYLVGGPSGVAFEAFGRKVPLVWGIILWAWPILSALASHHNIDAKPYYARAARAPILFRITAPIAVIFGTVSLWRVLELLARLILMPFGGAKPATGAEMLPLSVMHAKSLADHYAPQKRDPGAYAYALSSGEEGIDLTDGLRGEWKFFYYLPARRRQLEITVSGGKHKAKKSKHFPGPPPERILEEWVDPSTALQAVRRALDEIFIDAEEPSAKVCLYLPASQFAELVLEVPPEEKVCWLISAFDEDMELIRNFFVDAETSEIVEDSHPGGG